ncbi:carboxymuconolactone decarboxylase family protein, partial [Vibrio parahaemolyticus EKP-021]
VLHSLKCIYTQR